MDIKSKFRHVMDFPEEGIDFIDITTVLGDKDTFKEVMDAMIEMTMDYDFDIVVAPESRGFILGTPIAYVRNRAFAPIRKKGKLPYKTVDLEYKLEYGSNILEIHEDAIKKASAYWWWTICWRPVVRHAPMYSSSRSWAALLSVLYVWWS